MEAPRKPVSKSAVNNMDKYLGLGLGVSGIKNSELLILDFTIEDCEV
jgi:hypothetical protein